MAAPTEKDVTTMPTQKLFKQRVRARMAKTGESYTTARQQLLRKATRPAGVDTEAVEPTAVEPAAVEPAAIEHAAVEPAAIELAAMVEQAPSEPTAIEHAAVEPAAVARPSTSDGAAAPIPQGAYLVADDSMRRATGRGHLEWFAELDSWGATDHNHTDIARWLSETHGVPGWWTQNITVAYERARGLRARHQMRDGFSVSVTRTVAVAPERALDAFTDAELRRRWLPDAPLTQRPTRAALSARFDWADPPSRVIVSVVAKGAARAVVAVAHEQIPDADTGERLKRSWRDWLGQLKDVLEGD